MRELEFEQRRKAQLDKVIQLAERGLEMQDPLRVDVRGELIFGSNVRVDVYVIFKGTVVLGNNVSVGANCIIEDSVIEEGVEIRDFTTVSDARVGVGTRVGPYARIRPGSVIGRSCQIGNFVETKDVTIGADCKINHHSFVGNATIGEGVVIGAGSITCNHNGHAINSIEIEDHAYIGSGVMMIAPVRIGRSAVIGAGSTITENVAPGTLAIARAKQLVKRLPGT